MSRYDFHLSAARLAIDDPRFSWDTHSGGDFDLVDYVHGRTTFLADYRRCSGANSVRSIPTRATTRSRRRRRSRSRVDRNLSACSTTCRGISAIGRSRVAIAWNVLERACCSAFDVGGTTVDVRADARQGRRARLRRLLLDGRRSTSSSGGRSVRTSGSTGARYGETIRRHRSVISRAPADRRPARGGRAPDGQGGAARTVRRLRTGGRRRPARPAEPAEWAFAGFRLVTN